jgi:hypothetical protein
MKKYFNLLITSLIFTVLLSCDDELDENVFSSITQQSYNYTTKDFYQVIASIYPPLRNVVSGVDSYFIPQEVTADAIVMTPNASGWDDGGRYRVMHYQTWNSEQPHINAMWNWFYRGALLANNIIAQLENDEVPSPSASAKEQGIAEVRAMRAYYYWQICDNFGDAPLVTSSSGDLPSKTSRAEIYNFVVSELNAVIPALSDEQGGNMYGRMNKWGAKAMLANIYLNAEVYTGQAHWNECIAQCDEIINSGKCALSPNYTDPFRAHGVENNKEVLFTVPYDKLYAGGNSIHMWSWHTNSKKTFLTQSAPWGDGAARGVSQFVDTYDPDDKRLTDSWLIGPQFEADGVTPVMCEYELRGQQIVYSKDLPDANYAHEGEGYRMFKYEIEEGTTDNSNTDVPLFRFAQVLMMKAECLLRLGQPGAGALVTQVRQRAFKDNPEKATVTDEQLKGNTVYKYGYVENYQIVDPDDQSAVQFGRMYDELGWEFAWELFRRRDAIRFGVYTKKSWLSHKPQGDYRTVFPMPEIAVTSNPNLEQNPSYGSK